ncbi:MAG: hypothetical protein IPM38_05675 [Ignavibacteria bacterium]|nr:hypothetical protein [Ignavibacteria bacterium]
MTTQQLFVAYCEHLDGIFVLENFINKILYANGVVGGYENIEKYKTVNNVVDTAGEIETSK